MTDPQRVPRGRVCLDWLAYARAVIADDARGPLPVRTGALDDRYGWHLLAGLVAWLVTILLVAGLVLYAPHAPIDVIAFFIVLCVGVATMGVVMAVEVLRPELMRDRAEPPERPLPPIHPERDALGRRVAPLPPAPGLTGEILVELGPDGVRRYVPQERSR